MDEEYQREEELRQRQGGRTFRVGRALRRTYDVQDEELEPAVTRLMLELARVPTEGDVVPAARPLPPAPGTVAAPPPPVPSLWRRLADRLRAA